MPLVFKRFSLRYPETKVISTERAFMFMDQFGFVVPDGQKIQVKEGDSQKFGKHEVHFITAQMVHWPEAMVSFDATNGVLFSAGTLFRNIYSFRWKIIRRRS